MSSWSRGYKTFSMLSLAEHEVLNAYKNNKNCQKTMECACGSSPLKWAIQLIRTEPKILVTSHNDL